MAPERQWRGCGLPRRGQRLVTLREAQTRNEGLRWWEVCAVTGLKELTDGRDENPCLVGAFVMAQANGGYSKRLRQ